MSNEKPAEYQDRTAASIIRAGGILLPADKQQFPTRVFLLGDDLVCPLGIATCFGGGHDRDDDGRTASGVRTDGKGGIVGCALPMPSARGCAGTPFPQIPWGTEILVQRGAGKLRVPLIDVGPSGGLKSEAILDLTAQAWEKLLGREPGEVNVNSMEAYVCFTVPGGRRFLGDYYPKNGRGLRAVPRPGGAL